MLGYGGDSIKPLQLGHQRRGLPQRTFEACAVDRQHNNVRRFNLVVLGSDLDVKVVFRHPFYYKGSSLSALLFQFFHGRSSYSVCTTSYSASVRPRKGLFFSSAGSEKDKVKLFTAPFFAQSGIYQCKHCTNPVCRPAPETAVLS